MGRDPGLDQGVKPAAGYAVRFGSSVTRVSSCKPSDGLLSSIRRRWEGGLIKGGDGLGKGKSREGSHGLDGVGVVYIGECGAK